MFEREPSFIPSLPLHVIFRIRPIYWHQENLVVVAQGLSLKYPDKERWHSRKSVQPQGK